MPLLCHRLLSSYLFRKAVCTSHVKFFFLVVVGVYNKLTNAKLVSFISFFVSWINDVQKIFNFSTAFCYTLVSGPCLVVSHRAHWRPHSICIHLNMVPSWLWHWIRGLWCFVVSLSLSVTEREVPWPMRIQTLCPHRPCPRTLNKPGNRTECERDDQMKSQRVALTTSCLIQLIGTHTHTRATMTCIQRPTKPFRWSLCY